jgi:hypothetical protein
VTAASGYAADAGAASTAAAAASGYAANAANGHLAPTYAALAAAATAAVISPQLLLLLLPVAHAAGRIPLLVPCYDFISAAVSGPLCPNDTASAAAAGSFICALAAAESSCWKRCFHSHPPPL